MCRFLLVRSKEKILPTSFLHQFADMCEKSRDTDGDPQDDGWGVAWKDQGEWKLIKSLQPIWKDREKLAKIPETHLFVSHVRSPSFPQHKGVLVYNQPYIHNDICFVFNGRIYGVNITRPLAGTIGAQKIFSLFREELEKTHIVEEALARVNTIITTNTRRIQGVNIGIVHDETFYILCQYEEFPLYFGIQYYQNEKITIVCSEPIGSYDWKTMQKGEIITL